MVLLDLHDVLALEQIELFEIVFWLLADFIRAGVYIVVFDFDFVVVPFSVLPTETLSTGKAAAACLVVVQFVLLVVGEIVGKHFGL